MIFHCEISGFHRRLFDIFALPEPAKCRSVAGFRHFGTITGLVLEDKSINCWTAYS